MEEVRLVAARGRRCGCPGSLVRRRLFPYHGRVSGRVLARPRRPFSRGHPGPVARRDPGGGFGRLPAHPRHPAVEAGLVPGRRRPRGPPPHPGVHRSDRVRSIPPDPPPGGRVPGGGASDPGVRRRHRGRRVRREAAAHLRAGSGAAARHRAQTACAGVPHPVGDRRAGRGGRLLRRARAFRPGRGWLGREDVTAGGRALPRRGRSGEQHHAAAPGGAAGRAAVDLDGGPGAGGDARPAARGFPLRSPGLGDPVRAGARPGPRAPGRAGRRAQQRRRRPGSGRPLPGLPARRPQEPGGAADRRRSLPGSASAARPAVRARWSAWTSTRRRPPS